jgi:hypothetical protein
VLAEEPARPTDEVASTRRKVEGGGGRATMPGISLSECGWRSRLKAWAFGSLLETGRHSGRTPRSAASTVTCLVYAEVARRLCVTSSEPALLPYVLLNYDRSWRARRVR